MNKESLRIIYMGTPDFAVLPLKTLVENGYNIVGVITNPDKPAGRGQKLQESAVKKYAQEVGLNILQPEKFRNEEFLQALKNLKADLQLVIAFKMLPEVVWNMPRLGTVNLHASLLPAYRGAAPINWAIINGEKKTGLTTFLLQHEIDTGNVLFRQEVEISDNMTAGELHDELMIQGAELIIKTVDAMIKGDYPLISQESLTTGNECTQAPKIFKDDMKIDWSKDINQVYNHIRGLSPFPAAWTELKNTDTGETISMKVYQSSKILDTTITKGGIIRSTRETLEISAIGGWIKLEEIQLAGKKRMKTEDFLRGFNLSTWN